MSRDDLRHAVRAQLASPMGTILFGLSCFLLLFIAWDESAGGWRRPERTYWHEVRFTPKPDYQLLTDEDRADLGVKVTVLIVYITHEPRGLLAPVASVDRLVVHEPGYGFPPVPVSDPGEAAQLKARSLQHVTAINWEGLGAANIRPSGLVKRRTLWFGFAFAVGIALTGAGFLLSLGWIPRSVVSAATYLRTWRSRRATAAGRCSTCGYDVSGLLRCPECGHMLPERARSR